MTPSINLHTNSKTASIKGSKNSITFSPDSKSPFHTTLINNQRITKRLFFPTSHSQSLRSERTDEREGCESSEATTTGAGVGVGDTVSSTKSTSRYNHCPRNSTILESRPTTNTTHFNFKTTISTGIALATDRRSSSTSSTTPQQQHQQHCRTVSSSSSNNGCLQQQQQQQPLFSSADNLVSKEISIKNKTNSASVSDDDDVNEKDIVDVNDLSYLQPVLVVNNKNNSNEDDNSDNESFLSDTDSFDHDDEKMHSNNSNNNKNWRSSGGNSSTTESHYRGVSSYLTPSPRPLNAFVMSSLEGSPFLPQAPPHYAQVTPQYPRQSIQPEVQESYNTQIPLSNNDYHTTLQRVCGTTTSKEEIDDDENDDHDDESVDWQGGFYSNNNNENDDDNNESAPYHFLAARTGSNIHRCMSFDDDDYDEIDRDGCAVADAGDSDPIDFSAAFRIPNNSTTTESVSR